MHTCPQVRFARKKRYSPAMRDYAHAPLHMWSHKTKRGEYRLYADIRPMQATKYQVEPPLIEKRQKLIVSQHVHAVLEQLCKGQ